MVPILTTEQQTLLYATLRPLAEMRNRTLAFYLEVQVDPDGGTRYIESEEFVDASPPPRELSDDDLKRLPKAELHMAGRWDCDACGKESFIRAVRLEDEQLRKHLGMEDTDAIGQPEEAHRYVWPNVLGCGHCGSAFRLGAVV